MFVIIIVFELFAACVCLITGEMSESCLNVNHLSYYVMSVLWLSLGRKLTWSVEGSLLMVST